MVLKPMQLRMVAIALCLSAKDGARQQCFAPKCY